MTIMSPSDPVDFSPLSKVLSRRLSRRVPLEALARGASRSTTLATPGRPVMVVPERRAFDQVVVEVVVVIGLLSASWQNRSPSAPAPRVAVTVT